MTVKDKHTLHFGNITTIKHFCGGWVGKFIFFLKLKPAIFPLSQHLIRFHKLPADTTQRFIE